MKKSCKFLTAVAGVALVMSAASGAFAAQTEPLSTNPELASETLLSNNPEGVDMWFNSLQGWNIELLIKQPEPQTEPAQEPDQAPDDLPF